uniref:Uncharacterized protein n=1 Tax=Anguilla anguilla TaxID=7936 RepID=A0A0E9XJ30_ANGAN
MRKQKSTTNQTREHSEIGLHSSDKLSGQTILRCNG